MISCSSNNTQGEKIDLTSESHESSSSNSVVKKPERDRPTSEDLIKEYFASLDKLKNRDRIDKYNELKKKFQVSDKQNLLYRSIQLSDLELTTQLLNELSSKNSEILSDYHFKKIHDRYFEWEKSDTLFLDFLVGALDISALDRQDSIYRLIRAINSQRYDLVTYYLNNGFQHLINETAYLTNAFDEMLDASPMNWSIHQGDTSIAELFVSRGGLINREALTVYSNSSSTEYIFKKLLSKGYSSKEILINSLWEPVFNGDYDKVQKLIQLGSDVNETNNRNETPIFLTLQNIGSPIEEPMSEKLRIMNLLLKSGANVDHQNENGVTPLMYSSSIFFNDGKIIKLGFAELLLKYGADQNVVDNQENNFWDHVLSNKNETFMKHFTNKGIVPEEFLAKFDSSTKVNEETTKNALDSWTPQVFQLKDTTSNSR